MPTTPSSDPRTFVLGQIREREQDDATVKQKLTRSQTLPLHRDTCFFCEQGSGYWENLHSVSTSSAGKAICASVDITGNDKLLVKLQVTVDSY